MKDDDRLAALHDAIQRLPVYRMEGEIDGTPFSSVLVRRHEVHEAIAQIVNENAITPSAGDHPDRPNPLDVNLTAERLGRTRGEMDH